LTRSRRWRYIRFLALAAIIVTVVLAIGYQPTRHVSGSDALPAMLAGGGIGFIGAALAGVVLVAADPKTPVERMNAVFFAMAVRVITAVVLGAAAVWSGNFARSPLLFWLAMSYVALLPLEVKLAIESQ
jgi:hypothetical protein